MNKDWIIEVLGDLHGFAVANGLPLLASRLEETRVVAIAEIVQGMPGPGATGFDDAEAGRPAGTAWNGGGPRRP